MQKLWNLLARNWQKKREISGITTEIFDKQAREETIFSLLNRTTQIDAINMLMYAYKPEARVVDLSRTAIAIDSSAFLRIGSQTSVVDYLQAQHEGPIILPGQSIQEFWNNNLNVADSISTGISKKFEQLRIGVEKVDKNFQDYSARFTSLIDEFRATYGYAYDGNTVRRTITLLEILREKAITSYVSRGKFESIAVHRKKTKTPPGFKDDGDGDFYVWIDMLDALLIAKQKNIDFNQVILVTNDRKLDWSREGVTHPLLTAEIKALVGADFETWDITKLNNKINSITD